MCRLFAIGSDQPIKAAFWLLGAQVNLIHQSHTQPDGAGIGWFDEHGNALTRKRPMPAHKDNVFSHTAQIVKSPIVIGHLRNASTGLRRFRNTHPFSQGGFIFAHNGVIEGADILRDYLGDSRFQPEGETDSELFFCCLLKSIYNCDTPKEGIVEFLKWAEQNVPIYAANFILAGQGDLFALRWPEKNPLWYLDTQDLTSQFYQASTGLEAVVDANARLIIATEKLDDNPGWEMLKSGELLWMKKHGTYTKEGVLNDPIYLLTQADLDKKAQASQDS